MATGSVSVTNTFVNNTVADGPQVSQNFTDLVDYINNRDDGTDEWQVIKVTATVANAVVITGNQSTTVVSIDNTATDGDPVLAFQLGGTSQFTMGVDDGDSDAFKIGTTAIGTATTLQIPTGGSQVQFADGSAGAPSVANIGDPDTGVYFAADNAVSISAAGSRIAQFDGSNGLTIDSIGIKAPAGSASVAAYANATEPDSGMYFTSSGTQVNLGANGTRMIFAAASQMNLGTSTWEVQLDSNGLFPSTNNQISLGKNTSNEWADVNAVLINGADYGFANGFILREYPATYDDVQNKGKAWLKENADKGIQLLNKEGELICVLGKNGTVYAKNFKSLDDLGELNGTDNN